LFILNVFAYFERVFLAYFESAACLNVFRLFWRAGLLGEALSILERVATLTVFLPF
jgi:hypothetical protein